MDFLGLAGFLDLERSFFLIFDVEGFFGWLLETVDIELFLNGFLNVSFCLLLSFAAFTNGFTTLLLRKGGFRVVVFLGVEILGLGLGVVKVVLGFWVVWVIFVRWKSCWLFLLRSVNWLLGRIVWEVNLFRLSWREPNDPEVAGGNTAVPLFIPVRVVFAFTGLFLFDCVNRLLLFRFLFEFPEENVVEGLNPAFWAPREPKVLNGFPGALDAKLAAFVCGLWKITN